MDSLSLEAMMGPARVIEIPETATIGVTELKGCGIERGERILLKTSTFVFAGSASCPKGPWR